MEQLTADVNWWKQKALEGSFRPEFGDGDQGFDDGNLQLANMHQLFADGVL